MTAEAFVSAARALRGARWRHRGRKPWAVDCIGLVVLAGREAGLTVEDERLYGREPWDDRLRAGLRARFGDPLSPGNAEPGDIGVFRYQTREPAHVGVIGGGPHGLTLIHSHNIAGVVERGLSGPLADSLIEVYRPWQ